MSAPTRVYLSHIHHEDDDHNTTRIKAALAAHLAGESPAEGEEPPRLEDAEVMVVLIGEHTWRSPTIAEELRAALAADLEGKPRCGLVGILLNSYDYPSLSQRDATGNDPMLHPSVPKGTSFWPHNTPRALFEQTQAGYAALRPYSAAAADLEAWIHEAAVARIQESPARPGPVAEDIAGDIGWHGPSGSPIVGGAVHVRR